MNSSRSHRSEDVYAHRDQWKAGIDAPLLSPRLPPPEVMKTPTDSKRRHTLGLGSNGASERAWGATGALSRLTSKNNLDAALGALLQAEDDEAVEQLDQDYDIMDDSPRSTDKKPDAEAPGTAVDAPRITSKRPPPTGLIGRIPGVLIGTTMNIMLSVPFGLAFFPAGWEPFPVPRAVGMEMFLFSTFICQMCMTVSSDFPCAMGMMMVENIPFMHTLANGVIAGQGKSRDALATTMMAFTMSTLLMGICFFALGKFRLGRAVSYFPRHFLIGCIGGIGIFVTKTGFEVSTGVAWSWTWASVEQYGSPDLLPLFAVSVSLVIVLNILLRLINFTLLPPCFFVGIIPAFYVVLLAVGGSVDDARDRGWIFPQPPATDISELWEVFDMAAVRWDLIFIQTPTMVALTLFGLMHAPINIPSLSMSTGMEVDMNRELMVHGVSNLASGMLGGLPNYLCYSNSLLYFKCEGGGRGSGAALSAILFVVLLAGPGAIAYVPRCMAGTLLIHVGLDLTREALYDSLEGFDSFEYGCVLAVTVTMTIFGMTAGLGFGLVLSAISFTLQNMRHCEPVRGMMPATTLRSSARRTAAERELLTEELHHVIVVQLQGTIFFGNATVLSSQCEEILAEREDIKALVLDFTLVRSLESSAAETIAKIYAIARRRGVTLVYNRGSTQGFPTSAPLSTRLGELKSQKQNQLALHMSDELDEALAWVEDQLLGQARSEGKLQDDPAPAEKEEASAPLALRQLRKLMPREAVGKAEVLLSHMVKQELKAGSLVWRQGSRSECCVLLSEGLLVSQLEDEAGTAEDCRPGCIIGEYAFLNCEKRISTVSVKEDCVVYVLDRECFDRMLVADPYLGYVLARISISYLGMRCNHIANRIWDTRCLPI